MDAVKFLEEYSRICNKHGGCVDCPMETTPLCVGSEEKYSLEESEMMVEIVEDWSRENPEIIGKKYIIEIDKADRDRGRKQYHVKGAQGFWISDGNITDLEEYKEHDACKGCKYEDKTEKEEPCVCCRYAYRDKWEVKR